MHPMFSFGERQQRDRLSAGLVCLGFVFSIVLACPTTQVAAQSPSAGMVENVLGTLIVVRPDGIEERAQGKTALPLFEWDTVKTEAASQALIGLADGIQVAVNENSVFKVLARWEKAKGFTRIIRLQQGEMWFKDGRGTEAVGG